MTLPEFLDLPLFGTTVRTVARVLVFGGIGVILLRKFLRRIGRGA